MDPANPSASVTMLKMLSLRQCEALGICEGQCDVHSFGFFGGNERRELGDVVKIRLQKIVSMR